MKIWHPHDMQAFYRMHNVKRFPTGPHTAWSNRAEMGVRMFKKFLSAPVDTASKKSGPDHSVQDHACPVGAQGSDGEKHTGNSAWQNTCGVSRGEETKRSHGPSFHESRTADLYTNQTGSSQ